MKKIILLSLFLIALLANAQNKKFDALIKKFDVVNYTSSLERGKADLFWDAVWRNNERLTKLYNAISKKKSIALHAQKDLREATGLASLGNSYILPNLELQSVADSLLKVTGIKTIFNDAKLSVIESNEINAGAYPDGHMFITTGAIISDKITAQGLLGICAHEISHFLLQHSLDNAYAYRKQERTNKIVAGITATVSIAANAYAQMNGAVGKDSWDYINKNVQNLIQEAQDKAIRYKFKYSREQEIEADIIAYRFLEYLGLRGQYYIDTLKALETDNDVYHDEESDHPTTDFRIKLLEYMASISSKEIKS